jgi:hypothetical protein
MVDTNDLFLVHCCNVHYIVEWYHTVTLRVTDRVRVCGIQVHCQHNVQGHGEEIFS